MFNKLNYRSRAAFKLIDINKKFNIIKKGQKILDLGSSPGGWSQVASEIINSDNEKPDIIAVDILDMNPVF